MIPADASPFWKKADDALKKCQARFMQHPAVTLIDLGLIGRSPATAASETAHASIGIRIHLHPHHTGATADFPTEIDGIPVDCITGFYQAEEKVRETNMNKNINLKREGVQADDLRQIDGIGPKFAQALIEVGITSFEILASYTSDTLYALLRESTDVKITPDRILDKDWIGQARARIEYKPPQAATDLREELAELIFEEPDSASPRFSNLSQSPKAEEIKADVSDWHQHAGFSLFFELGRVRGEDGSVWQTRVYHDESGEETLFSGMKQADWAGWIVEKVQQSLLKSNVDIGSDQNEIQKSGDQVSEKDRPRNQFLKKPIFDVAVKQLNLTETIQEENGLSKLLHIDIDFAIQGKDAGKLIEQATGYVFEIEGREQNGQMLLYHESSKIELKTDQHRFALHESIPFPAVGRYQINFNLIFDMPYGQHKAILHQMVLNIIP